MWVLFTSFAPIFKIMAMEVITKIADLQRKIAEIRAKDGTVGLVPTMGALHNGHLELVKRCVAENSICVVSVFVNPTQFNDKNDLLHYPRTLDADCRLLESAGCAIAFAPEVEEMYPVEDTRVFNLGTVAEVMEGKYRPGHFNGVAQIVSKLFDAVQPDRAYFGEKDFDLIEGKKDGVPTKPAPEIIYNILGTLGVKAEEAVLIGDSDVDVMTAKNAGLDCIGCEWGFRGREELENAGAKYIAEVPQDIVSICHEINRI